MFLRLVAVGGFDGDSPLGFPTVRLRGTLGGLEHFSAIL